jgi:recombination protein RecR
MASPLDRLTHALAKLPSIGEKTAQRLAFFVQRASTDYAQELAEAVLAVKQEMRTCTRCLAPAPRDPCAICSDYHREQDRICVVGEPADVNAIERTGAFRGIYHIVHGVLSPLDGIGPDDLKIDSLLRRLRTESVSEVILAMNPTVDGEATATYISQLIKPLNVELTRLAGGMPVGAEVEYIDPQTLALALTSRRPM